MSRTPDPREIVLMAMYAEHLKSDGDYNRVRAKKLDIEPRAFLWGLIQLRAEELIGGVAWIPPAQMNPEKVTGLLRDKLHLTHAGIEEAERIIDAKGVARAERLCRVAGWFQRAGEHSSPLQALAVAADAGLL